jgi:hypothetical protein
MSYIVNETYTIFFYHFLLLNLLTVLKLICKWFPSFYNWLFILIKIRNIWNLNSYLHKLLYSRIIFINVSDLILIIISFINRYNVCDKGLVHKYPDCVIQIVVYHKFKIHRLFIDNLSGFTSSCTSRRTRTHAAYYNAVVGVYTYRSWC